MTTALRQIELSFKNEWFHISDLGTVNGLPKTLGIQATLVAGWVFEGKMQYHPNSKSMARLVVASKQDSCTALRKYFQNLK